jgi:hypothetical protein
VITVSGPWYDSGTLWAAVAAITGAGVLLLALWAAVAGWLRRRRGERLLYTAEITPLLTARPSLGPLEVRYQDEPLDQPALAELRFRFATQHDVPTTSFDADRPLRFNLGADIAALLRVLTTGGSEPVVKLNANWVEIAPGLFRQGQVITAELLVSGTKLDIECDSPLIDVKDVQTSDIYPDPPGWWINRVTAGAWVAFFIIMAYVATSSHSSDANPPLVLVIAFLIVVFVLLVSLFVTVGRAVVAAWPRLSWLWTGKRSGGASSAG